MESINYSKMKFNSLQKYLEYLNSILYDLNELEQIRFIYLSLLSNDFFFNPEYIFGDEQVKTSIYNESRMTDNLLNYIFKNKAIVCSSLSYLFEYICGYYGHNVETLTAEVDLDSFGHVYNCVTLKNGMRFTVDLQKDLKNVQTNMQTRFFGCDSEQTSFVMSSEYIEKMDYKLGYISDGYYYADKYLYLLERAVQTPASIEEKIALLLSNFDVYYDTSAMQYMARKWYYEKLLMRFLTKEELNRINIIDCCTKGSINKEYFMCLIVNAKENKEIIFAFDNETKNFIRIRDLETINRIQDELKSDVNSSLKVKRIGKINNQKSVNI